MSIDVWRKAVAELPENLGRNYQLIENVPVDRIQQLQKYQLGAQALSAIAVMSGFGLYQDIKAMQLKKSVLTTPLKKIKNMTRNTASWMDD